MKIIKLIDWQEVEDKFTQTTDVNNDICYQTKHGLTIPKQMYYVFGEYYIIPEDEYKDLYNGDTIHLAGWVADEDCVSNHYDKLEDTPLVEIEISDKNIFLHLMSEYLGNDCIDLYYENNAIDTIHVIEYRYTLCRRTYMLYADEFNRYRFFYNTESNLLLCCKVYGDVISNLVAYIKLKKQFDYGQFVYDTIKQVYKEAI